MTNINISIIIPYYNSADSLEKLLTSIGIHSDVEVIIVDDYSNKDIEKYESIKNNFKSINFKFFENNTNKKGAGVARNIGLSNACGKWLLFADADDYFLDDWYIKLSDYFNSEFDIIFFTPISMNINGMKIGSRANAYDFIRDYENDKESTELRLRYTWSSPWSKLIRRNIVVKNNILFDETLYSNDVMFSVKTGYSAKNIFLSRQNIYCITEGNINSLTQNKTSEAFLIRCKVACDKCQFLYEKLGRYFYIQEPYYRLHESLQKNLGIKTFFKCFKIFIEAGVPITHIIPFNKYEIKAFLIYLIKRLIIFIHGIR